MTNEQKIRLELTGPIERIVGQSVVELESPTGTLGGLLAGLVQEHAETSSYLGDAETLGQMDGRLPPGLLVIRGGEVLPGSLATPVVPGETLKLMPMISGG